MLDLHGSEDDESLMGDPSPTCQYLAPNKGDCHSKTSIPLKAVQTMVERFPANKPKKEQRRAWGISGRYPTTDNLIAFKRAKALARRISVVNARENLGSSMCLQSSSTTSQQLWRRSKQRMAFIGILTFRYWKLLLCIRHL
ncbi:hypothetical protein TNCV_669441 [Trichonephila clavipes]|nr:hypothetical protein TNCV_669441 [Trichonephila clavipes]